MSHLIRQTLRVREDEARDYLIKTGVMKTLEQLAEDVFFAHPSEDVEEFILTRLENMEMSGPLKTQLPKPDEEGDNVQFVRDSHVTEIFQSLVSSLVRKLPPNPMQFLAEQLQDMCENSKKKRDWDKPRIDRREWVRTANNFLYMMYSQPPMDASFEEVSATLVGRFVGRPQAFGTGVLQSVVLSVPKTFFEERKFLFEDVYTYVRRLGRACGVDFLPPPESLCGRIGLRGPARRRLEDLRLLRDMLAVYTCVEPVHSIASASSELAAQKGRPESSWVSSSKDSFCCALGPTAMHYPVLPATMLCPLVMIGNRYLDDDPPPIIPESVFNEVLAKVLEQSYDHWASLKHWYVLDANAIPPCYVLQAAGPRGEPATVSIDDENAKVLEWKTAVKVILEAFRMAKKAPFLHEAAAAVLDSEYAAKDAAERIRASFPALRDHGKAPKASDTLNPVQHVGRRERSNTSLDRRAKFVRSRESYGRSLEEYGPILPRCKTFVFVREFDDGYEGAKKSSKSDEADSEAAVALYAEHFDVVRGEEDNGARRDREEFLQQRVPRLIQFQNPEEALHRYSVKWGPGVSAGVEAHEDYLHKLADDVCIALCDAIVGFARRRRVDESGAFRKAGIVPVMPSGTALEAGLSYADFADVFQEGALHRNYALRRAGMSFQSLAFQNNTRKIMEYVNSQEKQAFVINAKEGTGKTNFLSHVYEELSKQSVRRAAIWKENKRGKLPAINIIRFPRLTAGSCTLPQLLRSLWVQADLAIQMQNHEFVTMQSTLSDVEVHMAQLRLPPDDSVDLLRQFPSHLTAGNASVCLLLDDVHEYYPDETCSYPSPKYTPSAKRPAARDPPEEKPDISWLPPRLPSGVYVIMTLNAVKHPGLLAALQDRVGPSHVISLSTIGQDAAMEMVTMWLELEKRTLMKGQKQNCSENYTKNTSPLWLSVVGMAAARWPSWLRGGSAAVKEIPSATGAGLGSLLPHTIEEIAEAIFGAATNALGQALVKSGVSLITCSRFGLASSELLDLWARDSDVVGEISQLWDTPNKRIPEIVWYQLLEAIKPLLELCETHDAHVWRFTHQVVREAAARLYVPSAKNTHAQLAAYFHSSRSPNTYDMRHRDVSGNIRGVNRRSVTESIMSDAPSPGSNRRSVTEGMIDGRLTPGLSSLGRFTPDLQSASALVIPQSDWCETVRADVRACQSKMAQRGEAIGARLHVPAMLEEMPLVLSSYAVTNEFKDRTSSTKPPPKIIFPQSSSASTGDKHARTPGPFGSENDSRAEYPLHCMRVNKRKLSEEFYHVFNAEIWSAVEELLTSIDNIEAHFHAGREYTSQLLDNYAATLFRVTKRQADLEVSGVAAIQTFESFVRRQHALLSVVPFLTVQQALNEEAGGVVTVVAHETLLKRMTSGMEHPPFLLARCRERCGYVEGGCESTLRLRSHRLAKEVEDVTERGRQRQGDIVSHSAISATCVFEYPMAEDGCVTTNKCLTLAWEANALKLESKDTKGAKAEITIDSILQSVSDHKAKGVGQMAVSFGDEHGHVFIHPMAPGIDVVMDDEEMDAVSTWTSTRLKQCISLRGHSDKINGIAISADGQVCATASEDTSVRVWDLNQEKQVVELAGHGEPVLSVALSADASVMVSCSPHLICCWDWTAKPNKWLAGFLEALRACKEVDDFRFVARAVMEDFKMAERFCGMYLPLFDERFIPDLLRKGYNTLWTAFSDMALKATTESKLVATNRKHSGSVFAMSLSLDGSTLATAGTEGSIIVWDVACMQPRRTLRDDLLDFTFAGGVSLSPAGKYVGAVGCDGRVQVWRASSGKVYMILEGDEELAAEFRQRAGSDMSWSDSDDERAKGGKRGPASDSGSEDDEAEGGKRIPEYGLRVLDDASVVLATQRDVKVWRKELAIKEAGNTIDTSDEDNSDVLKKCGEMTPAQWFREFEKKVEKASVDFEKTLDIIRFVIKTRDTAAKILGTDAVKRILDFSAKDRKSSQFFLKFVVNLVFAARGNSFGFTKYPGHSGTITTLSTNVDASVIISSDDAGEIRSWNCQQALGTRAFRGHGAPVRSCAFSEDGRVAATFGGDGIVWNTGSERPFLQKVALDMSTFKSDAVQETQSYLYDFGSVAVSRSGAVVATGVGKTIAVLGTGSAADDMKAGVPPRMITNLNGHSGFVTSLSFAHDVPDTKRLQMNAARLRDVETSKLRQEMSDMRGLLVSGSTDSTIRVWDLGSQTNVDTIEVEGIGGGGASDDDNEDDLNRLSGNQEDWGSVIRHVAASHDGVVIAATYGCSLAFYKNPRLAYFRNRMKQGQNTDDVGSSDDRRVWSRWRLVKEFFLEGDIEGLAAVRSFELLATASSDGYIKLWRGLPSPDWSEAEEARSFFAHDGGVTCVALNGPGTILASTGADLSVKIWRVSSLSLLATIHGHTSVPTSLAFNGGGIGGDKKALYLLMSADVKGQVRVWNLREVINPSVQREQFGSVRLLTATDPYVCVDLLALPKSE